MPFEHPNHVGSKIMRVPELSGFQGVDNLVCFSAILRRCADLVGAEPTGEPAAPHDLEAQAAAAGLRLRKVRISDPRWRVRDSGLLIANRDSDSKPVLLESSGAGYGKLASETFGDTAAGVCIEAHSVYPRASKGTFDQRSWLAGSRLSRFRPAFARLCVGAGAASSLLAVAAVLARPGERAGMGIASLMVAGSTCFFLSDRAMAVKDHRARTIRIHARLWDRVLAMPITRLRRTPRRALQCQAAALAAALQHGSAAWAGLNAGLDAALSLWLVGLVRPDSTIVVAITMLFSWRLAHGLAAADASAAAQDATHHGFTKRMLVMLASDLADRRMIGASGWAIERVERVVARQLAARRREHAVARRLNHALRAVAVLSPTVAAFSLLWSGGLDETTVPAGLVVVAAAAAAARASAVIGTATGPSAFRRRRIARLSSMVREEPAVARADPGPIEQIELVNLSFRHDPAEPFLFRDIDICLRRGEVLAVAGPSGIGKSTMLRLITGLLEPTGGLVLVNGRPMDQIDQTAYRRRLGAIMQEASFEVQTIRRAIGEGVLPDADVKAAAILTGLIESVDRLPMGFETLLVAGAFPSSLVDTVLITRAVARRPDFLVLDETLSRIPVDEAAQLLTKLKALRTGVILCAHSPSILALADKRLHLENFQ